MTCSGDPERDEPKEKSNAHGVILLSVPAGCFMCSVNVNTVLQGLCHSKCKIKSQIQIGLLGTSLRYAR